MTSSTADAPASSPARVVVPDWSFADRIRKIRRDIVQLEQREFAEMLGVTRQRYAAWETGRTAPRDVVAIAQRVELAAGVPASWTLGLGTNITAYSGGDWPGISDNPQVAEVIHLPQPSSRHVPTAA